MATSGALGVKGRCSLERFILLLDAMIQSCSRIDVRRDVAVKAEPQTSVEVKRIGVQVHC